MVTDQQGTHMPLDIWYVPGLNDSIISKNWTQHSGLETSMDANKNFHLRSQTSPFHYSRKNLDNSNLKVVEYSTTPPSTVRVTITTPITEDPPASVPPASDPDPAPAPVPYLTYIPQNVPPQLILSTLFLLHQVLSDILID